jgi:hypothetical protein
MHFTNFLGFLKSHYLFPAFLAGFTAQHMLAEMVLWLECDPKSSCVGNMGCMESPLGGGWS